MTKKLDPSAFAAWGDERDERDGVQEVDEVMIRVHILDEGTLPDYSARPFAAWLHMYWHEFDEGNDTMTNGDVIAGAVTDWCGGRTR